MFLGANIAGPLNLWIPYSQIQLTAADRKYLQKWKEIVYILNMYRLFSLYLLPNQYRTTNTYIVFTLYLVLETISRWFEACRGLVVWRLWFYTFYKGLEHLQVWVSTGSRGRLSWNWFLLHPEGWLFRNRNTDI